MLVKKNFRVIVLYVVVGATSVALALYISTLVLTPSYSQNEEFPMPPPPPGAVEVPTGTGESEPMNTSEATISTPGASTEEAVINGGSSLPPPPPLPPGADPNLPAAALPGDSVEPEVPVKLEPEKITKNSDVHSEMTMEVEGFLAPFSYDNENRRDPFREYKEIALPSAQLEEGGMVGPLSPLQKYDLEEVQLVGIMWDVKQPKAMFLDPNEQIHIVGKDERIGRKNGYIAVIREGEVVIVETLRIKGELAFTTRILKLAR